VAAQDKLLVEGVSPSLYLIHKVAPKENYYSIGRIYNVSPKDIAPFNNLQLEQGLSLGQSIKIPLNNTNFYQSGNAANDETFVPVYYKIKEKEGLYRVAKNHNDMSLETLKQWNTISGDAVKNGVQLLVGYLKVKKELSGLAKYGIGSSIASTAIALKEEKTVPVTAPVKVPVSEDGAEKRKQKEPVQEIPVKEPEIITIAAEKEKVKPGKTVAPAETNSAIREKNTNDSDFKALYESQIKNGEVTETTGDAGVFKSTSGWTDKKYYCLYNSASPGTVVQISNPTNDAVVYAKVLDNIPDIKKNEGLLIVISNAAADALAVTAGVFSCIVKYSK